MLTVTVGKSTWYYSIVLFLLICSVVLTPSLGTSGDKRVETGSVQRNTAGTVDGPIVFFSDLESGPKSGWEGSSTKGAAVTIWGKNYGTTRGQNYVTVNGAPLTDNSDYAEWGAHGTAHGLPRGLERITFWLNDKCHDGVGAISVTVNGVTSNKIPFSVRNGNIYFIATTGNDSDNGQYASHKGWGRGPWKRLLMISPNNNRILRPGDTIYVRAGVYTDEDDENMLVHFRGTPGTKELPFAAIGYPAEVPILDVKKANRGGFYTEGAHYEPLRHWVFSKLKFVNGASAFGVWGTDIKIVGNHLSHMNAPGRTGLIMVDTSQNVFIYGNYFERCGYDMYMHNIYIKTHDNAAYQKQTEAKNVFVGWNEFDHWTADLNPDPSTKPSRGGAIEIQTESTALKNGKKTNNIYVHDNYFHDGDSQALYLFASDRVVIFNNIMANITCTNGGIRFTTMDNSNLLYNNTMYFMGPSSSTMVDISDGSQPIFKNNIFYAHARQVFFFLDSGSGAALRSEHDLYYGNTPPSAAKNTTRGNPRFLSEGADFHLQSASPAIDSGTTAVSAIVTQDYDGRKRSQGSGYAIGAFENHN